MKVLVTGAGGYIGSIVTEKLIEEGNSVVALDNLSAGHRESIVPQATFIRANLSNAQELDDIFNRHPIEAVMHLAAFSLVERSMTEPGQFFQNNIVNGLNLLNIMLKHSVHKMVFSSSAAVYGEPDTVPIEEDSPKAPINPYGDSKSMFENILKWYGHAYDLRSISLRYFNAAGASNLSGEDHKPETHLIPRVLKIALGQGENIQVFGTDYPTRDGSCIRDYVHVLDIARAHLLALDKLESIAGHQVYNLGNGAGYSVIEVVETARKVTGARIPTVMCPRRQGDPASLVASSKLARLELGWQPDYPGIDSIIDSAWKWQKMHPLGYKK